MAPNFPKYRLSLFVVLIACLPLAFAGDQQAVDDPLSSFQLAEGFQIELIAQEPLLADPVAMEIDEQGRIYVAEMPGYPLDVSGKGRIRMLEDTDGDGKLDASHIFADNIVLPTGLMRWKNGILVTSPPDVLYIEDADGDGVAETREVLLTGFARSNPQHNFNKPMYGLDNWIYVANNGIIWTSAYKAQFGGRGTEVHFPAQPDKVQLGKNANDRNLKFKPDSHELESLSGRSQFGHTFDAWGHHFLTSNATPQFHEVIAARYLARNPELSTRMAMQYTPAYGRNTTIYPITRDPEHQLLTDRGMITSAAGITYYLGGLFPEKYQQVTFIGEPVHNLVHALKVNEKGATFEATRIEAREEFLASTDSWFRPVNYYVGPDGALYVIDYYRQIVEHPEWMDDETAKSGKLKHGTESGRIYRITPEGTAPANWIGKVNLAGASTETLVDHLHSNNLWWRSNAQRLLVDQQDAAAAPLLETLLMGASTPEARVHALWTLDGLDALQPAHIVIGLQDEEAGVRENAIVLAEQHAATYPTLWDALLDLEEEPNTRVRFQLLCTLGFLDTKDSRQMQQRLLEADIDDPWVQLAALSTRATVDLALFDELYPMLTSTASKGRAAFVSRLAALITKNGAADDITALGMKTLNNAADQQAQWNLAILKGITEGMPPAAKSNLALLELRDQMLQAFSGAPAGQRDALLDVIRTLPTRANANTATALTAARAAAEQSNETTALRAQAIALLAHFAPAPNATLFKSLIHPAAPIAVQKAAIAGYGKADAAELAEVLVGAWPSLTPDARNAALDVLMRGQDRMASLLTAVASGTIQPAALGWDRTVVLMRDTKGDLKTKARELLSEPPGVRDEVVADYYASLALDGDIDAGKTAFSRVCSTCHQVGGAYGTPFGPDLGTIRHWSAKALLAKILKPQSTIADGYGLWSIATETGKTEIGLIATESPDAIQLKRQGQEDLTIARDAIASLSSLNMSAMPAGFELQLDKQEMADLIAFLRFN
ncbi:MAG: PVC-type heme-binding CxxCH protein [Bacteroidota bacterium]